MIHVGLRLVNINEQLCKLILNGSLLLTKDFFPVLISGDIHNHLLIELAFLVEIQAIMGHIVKDLQTHDEAVIDLPVEVKNRPIEDFDLARFQESGMVLAHQIFTLCGQLR